MIKIFCITTWLLELELCSVGRSVGVAVGVVVILSCQIQVKTKKRTVTKHAKYDVRLGFVATVS